MRSTKVITISLKLMIKHQSTQKLCLYLVLVLQCYCFKGTLRSWQ